MTIPDQLLAPLASAERVMALTGAGVPAESGVPTFRDAQTGFVRPLIFRSVRLLPARSW